jgi:putative peptidoglycan lipid II flippase
VLLLILPAAAGLAVLAQPVVAVLFQRGSFSAEDTTATARALLLYLPGLPAAAVDQMLLFAFYAHKRTLAPNLVQGVAVGIYAATALSTMRYATTLIQFPLGLVAAAVSFAVLPTLSRQASAGDEPAFRATLAMGMKVVLLLILPAAGGLAALAGPIVAALFQHGSFTADDTAATARALLLYLPGLPAAALDQMLLFAFYAHKRTLAPNLVQGAAVGIYALTALALLWRGLGVGALILGNSAQWIGHALILLLLSRGLLSLRGLRLGEALAKSIGASLLMGLAAWWLAGALRPFGGPLLQIAVAGGIAGVIYFGLCALLRVEALEFFAAAVRRRLKRS